MRWLWMCVVMLPGPLLAQAEMPPDANIKVVADAYLMKKPAPGFGAVMSMAEAEKVQLMAARTPLEALQALKEIHPFIELPDLMFDPQVKLDGPHLLGINVGARLGVLGDPIPLPATAESVAKLADMKVEVVDHFTHQLSPEMFNHPDRLALLAAWLGRR